MRVPQEDQLEYQKIQIDNSEGSTNLKIIALEMQQIFEAAPPTVITKADAPKFTLIYANLAFYQSSCRRAEEVIGMGVLEAFPEDPKDKETGNVDAFRTSLAACVRTKRKLISPVRNMIFLFPEQTSLKLATGRHPITRYCMLPREK